jgi:hypothetical protein
MDSRGPDQTCARCGERIGFYERFWWHQPDGSIVDSGYLEMREDDRVQDPGAEFYHRSCLGPAEPLVAPALRAVAADDMAGSE